ncbi:MAG TPA: ATP-dependent Clp protease adaptor ClpS [Bacteroidota bacterium]|nr:ATP-dependent Clp protease adaptor ClpS [Bacteroidota bacterium]
MSKYYNIYCEEYKPELVTDETDTINTAFPSKVILFNDNIHSFDEVIAQLIKAIKCSTKHAENLAWEVHTKGKACVYEGEIEDCLRVSGILEEIGLHTQIES